MPRRTNRRMQNARNRAAQNIGRLASRGQGSQGLYRWMQRATVNAARRRSAGGAGG